MAAVSVSEVKLDLTTAKVMVVGDKSSELDIIAQMLMGFGVSSIQRATSAEEGVRTATRQRFDMAVVESGTQGASGYDFVRDVRRHNDQQLKYMPIIILCGHLRKLDFARARDCGPSFLLTKPLSPQVLFDRIIWLARDKRQFVECSSYAGPDRRIKAYGPPVGMAGRRHDDLSEHVGEAKEANLSQDVVNDFFSPKKVSL